MLFCFIFPGTEVLVGQLLLRYNNEPILLKTLISENSENLESHR